MQVLGADDQGRLGVDGLKASQLRSRDIFFFPAPVAHNAASQCVGVLLAYTMFMPIYLGAAHCGMILLDQQYGVYLLLNATVITQCTGLSTCIY